jgi:hypothetical protein
MPLPVIADTFRVVLNWEEGASNDVNVMHVRDLTGVMSAATVSGIIEGAPVAGCWTSLSNGAHMTKLQVTPLDGTTATHEESVSTSDPKWAGQSASDYLPAVAVVVKLLTLTRGRSYRGRVFLPMTGEAVVSNGQITSGTQTAAQTGWETFFTNLLAADIEPVVASYKLSVATTVEELLVETDLATQRRRQSRLR